MLRQLEIPSRLVNGFRAGEYNGLSGHWTVRQKNAHSWVEAYFAPYGWVEFDPTPADPDSPTPAFLKTMAQLFDALDLWWSADVVNYDLRGQSHLVEAGRAWLQDFQRTARDFARQAAGSFGTHLVNLGSNQGMLSSAGLIVFLASVVILMTYFFFRRPFGFLRRFWRTLTSSYFGRDQGVAVVGFYAEALDLLKKRGWERSRNQTPLEFARNLARQPFGDALISLTAVYNRIRFGQLTQDGDFAEARDLLEDLRAPLRHGMPLERNRPKA
jgi:hypothetical protein